MEKGKGKTIEKTIEIDKLPNDNDLKALFKFAKVDAIIVTSFELSKGADRKKNPLLDISVLLYIASRKEYISFDYYPYGNLIFYNGDHKKYYDEIEEIIKSDLFKKFILEICNLKL